MEGRFSVPWLLKILFIAACAILSPIGLLMLVAPSKHPKLYEAFLRQNVVRREETESGRVLAIRIQGLIGILIGMFFGFFVWAMW